MSRTLLLDEMISPKVAEGLRARGIDSYGIAERGHLHSLPDPDVLELATREQRILVTFNILDYQLLDRQWAAAGREHGGIVYVAHKTFPRLGGAVGQLVDALDDLVTQPRTDAPKPGGICFL